MLTAFGDESSDETHQRVFAVGAVYGEQHQWTALEDAWTERTGGIEFHAADCDANKGNFEDRSDPENKALYKDLTILLANSGITGYAVAMDLISQNLEMPELLPESPYYKCFGEVVGYFAYKTAFLIPREQVKFTFDRRLEIQYNATSLYDYMTKLNEWDWHVCLHDEISFATRKTVGIQVADLWTREMMKRLDNEIGPKKRPVRKSFEALISTRRFGGNIYSGVDYYRGLKRAIENIDLEKAAPFHKNKYAQWLAEKGRDDNYANRLAYQTQYDALMRSREDTLSFSDVREWGKPKT